MLKRSKLLLSLTAAILAAGLVGASAFAYTEARSRRAPRSRQGQVRRRRSARRTRRTRTSKDSEACGPDRMKPDLLVNDGGLADAVVYIKKIESGKPWSNDQKKVVIDQKKCAFDKHVTLVAENGEIVFKNFGRRAPQHSAPARRSTAGSTMGVGAGKEMSKKFAKSEFVTLTCSVHPG